MRQADLDRAVARATRESTNLIRQLGFSLVKPPTSAEPTPSGGGSASCKPHSGPQYAEDPLAA
jgi:hypothetical protein